MDAISSAIETIIQKKPNIIFKLDEPLKNYTTFKVGGPAGVLFFPETTADFVVILDILYEHEISPLIMGNGSNFLVSDEKLDLAVINTSKLSEIKMTVTDNSASPGFREIEVEAGVLLSKLAVFAYEKELTGLEFAHGIPGTVGGAIAMNAGAYGGEMKDVVTNVTVYNPKTGMLILDAEEIGFSYRHSRFSQTDEVVMSARVRLRRGNFDRIKQKMDELSARRRESQPLDLPSGGSTFKRPKEGYAAALIENAGLKGFAIGGAQVSGKHSGFIVNTGDATFSDIMAVIGHVQSEVYKQFGVKLELEVKIVR